jgi:hypothetical protein
MDRRAVLAGGIALFAAPVAVETQQAKKVPMTRQGFDVI